MWERASAAHGTMFALHRADHVSTYAPKIAPKLPKTTLDTSAEALITENRQNIICLRVSMGLTDPPASAVCGGLVSWQDAGNCCSLQELAISFGSYPDREFHFLPVQYFQYFQHGRLLILAGSAA